MLNLREFLWYVYCWRSFGTFRHALGEQILSLFHVFPPFWHLWACAWRADVVAISRVSALLAPLGMCLERRFCRYSGVPLGMSWERLGNHILSLFVVTAPLGVPFEKHGQADLVAICGDSAIWGITDQSTTELLHVSSMRVVCFCTPPVSHDSSSTWLDVQS